MGQFDLDVTLMEFTDKEHGNTAFTIRDAVEGVQIFGGIGSGKTSGSGQMLALKYLKAGFGGLVLTAKPDEKSLWVEYCKAAGRENDLLVVEPGSKYFFNFLDYETKNAEGETNYTQNIVHVLKTVIQAGQEKDKGKSEDGFWESALDMLISNTIDLCLLAYGRISVETMYDIVQGAPAKDTLPMGDKMFQTIFDTAQKHVLEQIYKWKTNQSLEVQHRMDQDDKYYEDIVCSSIPDARTFFYLDRFFLQNYKILSDKTRSIIEFSFSGFLFGLLRDPIHSLFCKHASTFSPVDSLNGKIILLHLPVKTYHKVGRDSQIMFKYIWQRAMENRDVKQNGRPIFLWADEAQNFLHEHDAVYQATARSSLIATVYISQNLPNYHANMGGEKSDYKVKSFLGTLATKIFHANADIETNMYASNLIGEAYRESVTHTRQSGGGQISVSVATTLSLDKRVRPEEFMALKTGSRKNACVVEGYMHRQGNGFSNKSNFRKVRFKQS